MMMMTEPSSGNDFETECRRLLRITGKEFISRLETDDFAGLDEQHVAALKHLYSLTQAS